MKKKLILLILLVVLLGSSKTMYSAEKPKLLIGGEVVGFFSNTSGVGPMVQMPIPELFDNKLDVQISVDFGYMGDEWLLSSFLGKYEITIMDIGGNPVKFWAGGSLDYTYRKAIIDKENHEITNTGGFWLGANGGADYDMGDFVIPLQVGVFLDLSSAQGIAFKVKTGIMYKAF